MNAASVLTIPDGQRHRNPAPGMGVGVLERTYARPLDERKETWGEVGVRVAVGNALLAPHNQDAEFVRLRDHVCQGTVPMSGRHLEHGDERQPDKCMEMFTNCSTAATSFALFYLLLNGSGVGRDYSDAMMVVNWDNMPTVLCALAPDHADMGNALDKAASHGSLPSLRARLDSDDASYRVFEVPDTREGWAKAAELLETMTFEGVWKDRYLVLDFSKVRPEGAPIAGLNGKPASGPIPLMQAFRRIQTVKGQGWAPWKQAMFVDHYLADVVQMGGARRAARMSVKFWKDPGAIEFTHIKNDGGLWTSNNSLGVDREFWKAIRRVDLYRTATRHLPLPPMREEIAAYRLFNAAVEASYEQGTGEPGFINLDQLQFDETGIEVYDDGNICGNARYPLYPATLALTKAVVAGWKTMPYKCIVNPCGEVVLNSLAGYCVVGDAVPLFAKNDADAEDAVRTLTRALIRVNTMDCFYPREVARTNRIGVSMCGVHEYAWVRFGLTWHDLVNPTASAAFWRQMAAFRAAVIDEATRYSAELGLPTPHTFTTGKPGGTVPKIFALTEGFSLPAFRRYLRWVQYDKNASVDDIASFERQGYPVQHDVKDRATVALVGFPTEPTITQLGIPEKDFMTASGATMEEHYRWLRNLEIYWLGEGGNQISYTLKFDRERVDYATFRRTLLQYQPVIRCCTVMESTHTPERLALTKEKYGYLPEDPVSDAEWATITERLDGIAAMEALVQGVDASTFYCEGGACPI